MTAYPVADGCVFCAIVTGRIPSFRLWEDADTIAFMDINPANPGHALAVAKGHWPTIHALPSTVLAAVAATAQRVARAQQVVLAPGGINLIQANGPGAAQSVPHFHIHILPRAVDDGLSLNWTPRPGDREAVAALHARLLAAM
ncbi:MAG: HIT domain-containing protein [Alphaproteobacteria bacterium]|nr:HIT domain-containing protein [Alphaproteobacteria bacterium]